MPLDQSSIPPIQSTPKRYAAAVLFFMIAAGVNVVLPRETDQTHYFLFTAAVLASALLCGVGPGLLATGLSALASAYFFLAPVYDFRVLNPIGLGVAAAVRYRGCRNQWCRLRDTKRPFHTYADCKAAIRFTVVAGAGGHHP